MAWGLICKVPDRHMRIGVTYRWPHSRRLFLAFYVQLKYALSSDRLLSLVTRDKNIWTLPLLSFPKNCFAVNLSAKPCSMLQQYHVLALARSEEVLKWYACKLVAHPCKQPQTEPYRGKASRCDRALTVSRSQSDQKRDPQNYTCPSSSCRRLCFLFWAPNSIASLAKAP